MDDANKLKLCCLKRSAGWVIQIRILKCPLTTQSGHYYFAKPFFNNSVVRATGLVLIFASSTAR